MCKINEMKPIQAEIVEFRSLQDLLEMFKVMPFSERYRVKVNGNKNGKKIRQDKIGWGPICREYFKNVTKLAARNTKVSVAKNKAHKLSDRKWLEIIFL